MRPEISPLCAALSLTLLCGCGGHTDRFAEEAEKTESSASESVKESAPQDTTAGEASAPESKTSPPQEPSESDRQFTSLYRARKNLDVTMTQLKTVIFEERDAFKGEDVAVKLADLIGFVGSADSQDPKLYDIILKVKDNFDKVTEYLQARHISGAQQFYTEMEKYYQEWKAQMKR
jgi:hypothetical protein